MRGLNTINSGSRSFARSGHKNRHGHEAAPRAADALSNAAAVGLPTAAAPGSVHSHEDDLELYVRGRLGPERTCAVESHLLECQICRNTLSRCIGIERITQAAAGNRSNVHQQSRASFARGDAATVQEIHPLSLNKWRAKILNTSNQGLGILAPKSVLPGTIVQIRIHSAVELADVQHCSPWGGKGFQISLRLHSGF